MSDKKPKDKKPRPSLDIEKLKQSSAELRKGLGITKKDAPAPGSSLVRSRPIFETGIEGEVIYPQKSEMPADIDRYKDVLAKVKTVEYVKQKYNLPEGLPVEYIREENANTPEKRDKLIGKTYLKTDDGALIPKDVLKSIREQYNLEYTDDDFKKMGRSGFEKLRGQLSEMKALQDKGMEGTIDYYETTPNRIADQYARSRKGIVGYEERDRSQLPVTERSKGMEGLSDPNRLLDFLRGKEEDFYKDRDSSSKMGKFLTSLSPGTLSADEFIAAKTRMTPEFIHQGFGLRGDSMTEQQYEAELKKPEKNIVDWGKDFLRTLGSTTTGIIKGGVALGTPAWENAQLSPVYKIADIGENYFNEIFDTSKKKQDIWGDLAGGAASMMMFMLPNIAAAKYLAGVKNAETAVTMIVGALANGGSAYSESLKNHGDAGKAYVELLINAGMGLTEALPIASFFTRFDKVTGNGLSRHLVNGTVAQIMEEGVQEFFQQFVQGTTSVMLHDEDKRSLDDILKESAYAGLLGGILGGSMNVMGVGGKFALTKAQSKYNMHKLRQALVKEGYTDLPKGDAELIDYANNLMDDVIEQDKAKVKAEIETLLIDAQKKQEQGYIETKDDTDKPDEPPAGGTTPIDGTPPATEPPSGEPPAPPAGGTTKPKVVYSAAFVDTKEMTDKFGQKHPNLFSHHTTIAFKPDNIDDLPVGSKTKLKVIGRLTTDKVDVLLVENPLSKNAHPHITLSTADGVKPFASNSEIENNLDKIEPLSGYIDATYGYFDGQKDVMNQETEAIKKGEADAVQEQGTDVVGVQQQTEVGKQVAEGNTEPTEPSGKGQSGKGKVKQKVDTKPASKVREKPGQGIKEVSNKAAGKVFARLLKDEAGEKDYGIHGLLADWNGAEYDPDTDKITFTDTRSGTGKMTYTKKEFIDWIVSDEAKEGMEEAMPFIRKLRGIIADEINKPSAQGQKKPKVEKKPVAEPKKQGTTKKEVIDRPLKQISIDRKSFQNREDAFSQDTVDSIISDVEAGTYNPVAFNPIITWNNPKDGKTYILAGHSRYEAFRQLSERGIEYFDSIPSEEFTGTYEEAVEFATKKSNRLGNREKLTESANIFRDMRKKGTPEKDIVKEARQLEKNNASEVLALSRLNPKGKTISAYKLLDGTGVEGKTKIKLAMASIAGAREMYPELTDSHEDEMYEWLINKGNLDKFKNKTAFIARIERVVGRMDFNPDEILNLDDKIAKGQAEMVWDSKMGELSRELKAAQDKLSERRQKGLESNLSEDAMNTFLQKYEDEIRLIQKDIIAHQAAKHGILKDAEDAEINLFNSIVEENEQQGKVRERTDEARGDETVRGDEVRGTDSPSGNVEEGRGQEQSGTDDKKGGGDEVRPDDRLDVRFQRASPKVKMTKHSTDKVFEGLYYFDAGMMDEVIKLSTNNQATVIEGEIVPYGDGGEAAPTKLDIITHIIRKSPDAFSFNPEKAQKFLELKQMAKTFTQYALGRQVTEDEETDKELVAVHNLHEHDFRHMMKMGGFAMPSFAIIKAKHGFNKFGTITLFTDANTIAPDYNYKSHVFIRDAYTPTYPRVYVKKIQKEITKKHQQMLNVIGLDLANSLHLSSAFYTFEEKEGNRLEEDTRNEAIMYYYLTSTGRRPETKMQYKPMQSFWAYDTANNELVRTGNSRSEEVQAEMKQLIEGWLEKYPNLKNYIYGTEDIDMERVDKAVEFGLEKGFYDHFKNKDKQRELLREQAIREQRQEKYDLRDVEAAMLYHDDYLPYVSEQMSAAEEDSELAKVRKEMFVQNFIEDRRSTHGMAGDFHNIIHGVKEIDTWGMRHDMGNIIEQEKGAYEEWLKEDFKSMYGEEYIKDGKRKKLPHTLSNVMDLMRKSPIRAGEKTPTTGLAKAAAMKALKLPSIDAIRAWAPAEIKSAEEFHRNQRSVEDYRDWIVDKLYDYRSSIGDTWDYMDNLSIKMAGWAHKGNPTPSMIKRDLRSLGILADNVPDSLITAIKEFAKEMDSMGTEYFEAKIDDVMNLSQFKHALVPTDVSKDILKGLKDAGVSYSFYPGEENRRSLRDITLYKAATKNDLRFQKKKDKSLKQDEGMIGGAVGDYESYMKNLRGYEEILYRLKNAAGSDFAKKNELNKKLAWVQLRIAEAEANQEKALGETKTVDERQETMFSKLPKKYKQINKVLNILKKAFPGSDVRVVTPEQMLEMTKQVDSSMQMLGTDDAPLGMYNRRTGIIYLNVGRMNLDTPIHEFGHFFFHQLEKYNKELYTQIRDLVAKDVAALERIRRDSFDGDPTIPTDMLVDELLQDAVGNSGAKLFLEMENDQRKDLAGRFQKLLRDMWRWVGNMLGRQTGNKQLEDIDPTWTLNDIADAIAGKMLTGVPGSVLKPVNTLEEVTDMITDRIRTGIYDYDRVEPRDDISAVRFQKADNYGEAVRKLGKIGIEDPSPWMRELVMVNPGLLSGTNSKADLDTKVRQQLMELVQTSPELLGIQEDSEGLTRMIENEIKTARRNGRRISAEQERQMLTLDSSRQRALKELNRLQTLVIRQWQDYIKGQQDYDNYFKLLIMKAITGYNYFMPDPELGYDEKLVKRNAKTLRNFTALHQGALARTYTQAMGTEGREGMTLLKRYTWNMVEALQAEKDRLNVSNDGTDPLSGSWIEFPSKSKDPANFEENVATLSALAQRTPWCTSYNAREHLTGGDFSVYVTGDDMQPHIAIRREGDQIAEVRGILPGQRIESEYRDVSTMRIESSPGGERWILNNKINEAGERFDPVMLENAELYPGILADMELIKNNDVRDYQNERHTEQQQFIKIGKGKDLYVKALAMFNEGLMQEFPSGKAVKALRGINTVPDPIMVQTNKEDMTFAKAWKRDMDKRIEGERTRAGSYMNYYLGYQGKYRRFFSDGTGDQNEEKILRETFSKTRGKWANENFTGNKFTTQLEFTWVADELSPRLDTDIGRKYSHSVPVEVEVSGLTVDKDTLEIYSVDKGKGSATDAKLITALSIRVSIRTSVSVTIEGQTVTYPYHGRFAFEHTLKRRGDFERTKAEIERAFENTDIQSVEDLFEIVKGDISVGDADYKETENYIVNAFNDSAPSVAGSLLNEYMQSTGLTRKNNNLIPRAIVQSYLETVSEQKLPELTQAQEDSEEVLKVLDKVEDNANLEMKHKAIPGRWSDKDWTLGHYLYVMLYDSLNTYRQSNEADWAVSLEDDFLEGTNPNIDEATERNRKITTNRGRNDHYLMYANGSLGIIDNLSATLGDGQQDYDSERVDEEIEYQKERIREDEGLSGEVSEDDIMLLEDGTESDMSRLEYERKAEEWAWESISEFGDYQFGVHVNLDLYDDALIDEDFIHQYYVNGNANTEYYVSHDGKAVGDSFSKYSEAESAIETDIREEIDNQMKGWWAVQPGATLTEKIEMLTPEMKNAFRQTLKDNIEVIKNRIKESKKQLRQVDAFATYVDIAHDSLMQQTSEYGNKIYVVHSDEYESDYGYFKVDTKPTKRGKTRANKAQEDIDKAIQFLKDNETYLVVQIDDMPVVQRLTSTDAPLLGEPVVRKKKDKGEVRYQKYSAEELSKQKVSRPAARTVGNMYDHTEIQPHPIEYDDPLVRYQKPNALEQVKAKMQRVMGSVPEHWDAVMYMLNADALTPNIRTKEQWKVYTEQQYVNLKQQVRQGQFVVNQDTKAVERLIQNDIDNAERGGDFATAAQGRKLIERPEYRKEVVAKLAQMQQDQLDAWVTALDKLPVSTAFKFIMLKSVATLNYEADKDSFIKRNNKTVRFITALVPVVANRTYNRGVDSLAPVLKIYTDLLKEYGVSLKEKVEIVEETKDGIWFRFIGGKNAPNDIVQENAMDLMAMVQNSPWCTKTAAPTQLAGGEFFVFMSPDMMRPRIGVRATGNYQGTQQIAESRGVYNGTQEMEPEMVGIHNEFIKRFANAQNYQQNQEHAKEVLRLSNSITSDTFIPYDGIEADWLKLFKAVSHGQYTMPETLRLKLMTQPGHDMLLAIYRKVYGKNVTSATIHNYGLGQWNKSNVVLTVKDLSKDQRIEERIASLKDRPVYIAYDTEQVTSALTDELRERMLTALKDKQTSFRIPLFKFATNTPYRIIESDTYVRVDFTTPIPDVITSETSMSDVFNIFRDAKTQMLVTLVRGGKEYSLTGGESVEYSPYRIVMPVTAALMNDKASAELLRQRLQDEEGHYPNAVGDDLIEAILSYDSKESFLKDVASIQRTGQVTNIHYRMFDDLEDTGINILMTDYSYPLYGTLLYNSEGKMVKLIDNEVTHPDYYGSDEQDIVDQIQKNEVYAVKDTVPLSVDSMRDYIGQTGYIREIQETSDGVQFVDELLMDKRLNSSNALVGLYSTLYQPPSTAGYIHHDFAVITHGRPDPSRPELWEVVHYVDGQFNNTYTMNAPSDWRSSSNNDNGYWLAKELRKYVEEPLTNKYVGFFFAEPEANSRQDYEQAVLEGETDGNVFFSKHDKLTEEQVRDVMENAYLPLVSGFKEQAVKAWVGREMHKETVKRFKDNGVYDKLTYSYLSPTLDGVMLVNDISPDTVPEVPVMPPNSPLEGMTKDNVMKHVKKEDADEKMVHLRFQKEKNKSDFTDKFWKWFGKSKAVDDRGVPKIYFHATNKDFSEFGITRDLGYHVGTVTAAEKRIETAFMQARWGSGGVEMEMIDGVNIMPLYVYASNPLRMPDLGSWKPIDILEWLRDNYDSRKRGFPNRTIQDYIDGYTITNEDIVDYLEKQGFDSIVYKNQYERESNDEIKEVLFELQDLKNRGDREDVRQRLMEVQAHYDSLLEDSYILFSPNQLKSATGNRGTYDMQNPDIRYQKKKHVPYTGLPEPTILTSPPKDEMQEQMFFYYPSSEANYEAGNYILSPYLKWRAVKLRESIANEKAFAKIRVPDTKAVRDFMGDSVVVNKNGSPRVMAHATRYDFGKDGGEVAFTITRDIGYHVGTITQAHSRLDIFADYNSIDGYLGEVRPRYAQNSNVMPVIVRLENPLRLTDLGVWMTEDIKRDIYKRYKFDWATPERLQDMGREELKAELRKQGYDGIVYRNKGERGIAEHKVSLRISLLTSASTFLDSTRVRVERKYGYDSKEAIRIREKLNKVREERRSLEDEGLTDSYIVFDGTQLKSATGNYGDYSRAKDDIRYQLPKVPTQEEYMQSRKAYANLKLEMEKLWVNIKPKMTEGLSEFVKGSAAVIPVMEGSVETMRPLVLAHGTTSDFSEFLFSRDIGYHIGTVGQAMDRIYRWKYETEPSVDEGANIMPVVIRTLNPLRMPDLGEWTLDNISEALQSMGLVDNDVIFHSEQAVWDYLESTYNVDSIIYENSYEYSGRAEVLDAQRTEALNRRDFELMQEGLTETEKAKILSHYRDILQNIDYEIDGSLDDSYILPRRTQIKSAIGNNGLYSLDKGDIRFQKPNKGNAEDIATDSISEDSVLKNLLDKDTYDIGELSGDTGKSLKQMSEIMTDLEERGMITKLGKGKYKPTDVFKVLVRDMAKHPSHYQATHDKLYFNPFTVIFDVLARLDDLWANTIGKGIYKGLGKIAMKITPEMIKRLLVTNYGLSKSYLEAKREALIMIEQYKQLARDLAMSLKYKDVEKQIEFSRAEQRRLTQIIKGGVTTNDLLRQRADKVIAETKRLETLGKKLGVLPAETYNTKLTKKRLAELSNEKAKIQKEINVELSMSNNMPTKKSAALQRQIDRIDQQIRNHYKHGGEGYFKRVYVSKEQARKLKQYGYVNPTRLDLTSAIHRQDIPWDVRAEMGEILTASYPVAKSIMLEGRDVSLAKFFEMVAENPDLADDQERAGWVQLPEDKRLGKLSKMWVSEEIANDLNDVLKWTANDYVDNFIKQMTSVFKASKVVMNPATQFRNIMSNTIMMDYSGVSHAKQAALLFPALQALRGKGKYADELKASGLTSSTFAHAELGIFLDELQEEGTNTAFKNMSTADKIVWLYGKISLVDTALGRKAGDMYQFSESIFKTIKFIDGRQKGLSIFEARDEANKWLFDYNEIPPAIRSLREKWYGMPFVTWSYKAIPRVIEAAITRPIAFWKYFAIFGAITKYALAQLDMDDEEWEEIKKLFPERMKQGEFLLLPYRDDNGKIQLLDLTFMVPYKDVYNMMMTAYTVATTGKTPSEEWVIEGIANMIQNPILTAITDIKQNKNAFNDQPIVREGATPAEAFKSYFDYFYKMFMPPLAPEIPGFTEGGYSYEKLRSAIIEKPDYYGRVFALAPVIGHTMFGLKTVPVEQQLWIKKEMGNVSKEIESLNQQKGVILKDQSVDRETRLKEAASLDNRLKPLMDEQKRLQSMLTPGSIEGQLLLRQLRSLQNEVGEMQPGAEKDKALEKINSMKIDLDILVDENFNEGKDESLSGIKAKVRDNVDFRKELTRIKTQVNKALREQDEGELRSIQQIYGQVQSFPKATKEFKEFDIKKHIKISKQRVEVNRVLKDNGVEYDYQVNEFEKLSGRLDKQRVIKLLRNRITDLPEQVGKGKITEEQMRQQINSINKSIKQIQEKK